MVSLVVCFFLAFPPISYMNSSSVHSCYMPCPSHPPWLDQSWEGLNKGNLTLIFFTLGLLKLKVKGEKIWNWKLINGGVTWERPKYFWKGSSQSLEYFGGGGKRRGQKMYLYNQSYVEFVQYRSSQSPYTNIDGTTNWVIHPFVLGPDGIAWAIFVYTYISSEIKRKHRY
jgi:hypothetical protein